MGRELPLATCKPSRETVHTMTLMCGLSISRGSGRAGVEYVFTVTVSKGVVGGPAWSQYRSDNASCVISTAVLDVPHVSILPKVIGVLGNSPWFPYSAILSLYWPLTPSY